MIVFGHHIDTRNVGDRCSGPYRYFSFGRRQTSVVQFGGRMPFADTVIFGGGAIGNGLGQMALATRARVRIAWGVGMTRHGVRHSGPAPTNLDLYGSREWGQQNAIYVPCVSCMSPLFDRPWEIRHDAVLYVNADQAIQDRYPVLRADLPLGDNHTDFGAAVKFLGSGETVFTNSYHGAFWAQLLGRKVVLVNPYSSKFHGFKFAPEICMDEDWAGAQRRARVFPEALSDARAANMVFHAMVMDKLDSKALAHA